MDQGHYDCRDYYITPHFSATTIVSESPRPPLERHESFQELEERSRSPASQKPKFPLLQLPFELRQHILGYLLPHTKEFKDSGLLGEHVRNFSAVKKRGARGMFIPSGASSASASTVSNVVWQRGNINLLCVCKQLHDEVRIVQPVCACNPANRGTVCRNAVQHKHFSAVRFLWWNLISLQMASSVWTSAEQKLQFCRMCEMKKSKS
jgi:hypothetical protein